MNYNNLMRFLPDERKNQLQKVIDTLKIGGRSEKTIDNYVCAINRFFSYFNNEDNLKHKCWLLLAYSSGLRVEEIANLKVVDIDSKQHQLKVFGKRKKERFTVLTDFTIEYLRLYFKKYYYFKYNMKTTYTGYFLEFILLLAKTVEILALNLIVVEIDIALIVKLMLEKNGLKKKVPIFWIVHIFILLQLFLVS